MLQPARVALETLGCKLNQAETESMARELAEGGACIVAWDAVADIYILNSCTVTHVADSKSRQLLRRAHRLNPGAKIIVTGCYADRQPAQISAVPGVSLVVSSEKKQGLVTALIASGYLTAAPPGLNANRRTRVFVKAQDGCNRFCAYCVVPFVRGREKSRPAHEVISDIKARSDEGCREVVVTGTEIGSYSSDGLDIRHLLERVLDDTGITRLRLSSLQPQEVTPELLKLWADTRLCPHFHMSLQSGSDSVLARMDRRYTADEYRSAVDRIRRSLPHAAITTDIIVGFPGESHAEFMASLDYCRRMGFARIHVFPFSSRPGTKAAAMSGHISEPLKKERCRLMLAVSRESARSFCSLFVGREVEVLWEQGAAGIWSGYTPEYIRVYTNSAAGLTNHLTGVKTTGLYRDGVWGERIEEAV